MKFLKFWFPVILYSGMIFYVSGLPDLKVGTGWPFADKLAHILEYTLLGWLFSRALSHCAGPGRYSRSQLIFLSVLFCVLYGLSDEFHQLFVAGRTAELADVLSDGIGGLLGGIIYRS